MSQKSLDNLAAALKLPPADLKPFAALSEAQLQQLSKGLESAKARQLAALNAGIDGALSHIPFLLRGAVAKLVKP